MMTEHEPTLTEQLAAAKASADAAHADYQRRHTDWSNTLWYMAGNVHALHGAELTTEMDRLNQLAQEAYAAHQDASLADKVLVGLSELVNRRRTVGN